MGHREDDVSLVCGSRILSIIDTENKSEQLQSIKATKQTFQPNEENEAPPPSHAPLPPDKQEDTKRDGGWMEGAAGPRPFLRKAAGKPEEKRRSDLFSSVTQPSSCRRSRAEGKRGSEGRGTELARWIRVITRLTGGETLAGNQDARKQQAPKGERRPRPPQKPRWQLHPRRHGDGRWNSKHVELL